VRPNFFHFVFAVSESKSTFKANLLISSYFSFFVILTAATASFFHPHYRQQQEMDCHRHSTAIMHAIPSLPFSLETPIMGFQHRTNDVRYNPYNDVPSTPSKPNRVMSPASAKRLLLDRLEQVEVPSLSPASISLSPFKKMKRSLPVPTLTSPSNRSQDQTQHFQQALQRLKNGQTLERLRSLKEQEPEEKAKTESDECSQQQVLLNNSSSISHSSSRSSCGADNNSSDRSRGDADCVSRNSPIRSASFHPSSKPSLDGRAPPIRGRIERRNSARAA
jgi:hypothetical protein